MTKYIACFNWWFIGWMVMFILNLAVGIIDYLQNGISWPVNLVAIFGMIVLRVIK